MKLLKENKSYYQCQKINRNHLLKKLLKKARNQKINLTKVLKIKKTR